MSWNLRDSHLAEIKEAGQAAAAAGALSEAAAHFRRAIKFAPDDSSVYFGLSAVQHALGEYAAAAETKSQGIRVQPLVAAALEFEGRTEATLLVLKGAQGSRFTLNSEGKHRLSGGNFTLRYLIDRQRFRIFRFYLHDENLASFAALPPFDLIVNTIADADLEARPLRDAAAFCARSDAPVINAPDRVALTSRDGNVARLSQIEGLLCPKTVKISAEGGEPARPLADLEAEGLRLPLLLRRSGTHTGRSLERVTTTRAFGRYLSEAAGAEVYATEFIDLPRRGRSLRSLPFRYRRRLRVLFIDGAYYPATCHMDRHWNVHSKDRHNVMTRLPWMQAEEQAFIADWRAFVGPTAAAAVEAVFETIGLDFCGIDFNLMPDGRLLLYEVNPTMRHSFDYVEPFPYLRPGLERISAAFEAMVMRRAKKGADGGDAARPPVEAKRRQS